ncbi:ABC transporter substrate-binding protein [uncultured Clostridium sp.]|uniref:ABC transporter substrate-binding protein n=1 Tax=uncultured Clostridium sp. TaxID=59620 RepID=UPI0025EA73C0|nr:ABC transporter substrate-binding protein [uncultured Clostridium sp.]
MKKTRKILSLMLLIAMLTLSLVGCGSEKTVTMKDREGTEFTLPSKVEKIISTAPSNTEVLVELGLADKLVAVDKYSSDIKGIKEDLPKLDFRNPDAETIISLNPDIIIASGHNKSGNEDPFAAIKDAGITVVYIPSSNSIDGIYEDINFIADITGTEKKGDKIVEDMKKEISKIADIGKTITEKKKVYFEIGSAPSLFSFGKNTFLNEMIEIIGAENILANEDGWVSPSEEIVIKDNPDVILTNESDEAVDAIKSREGWQEVNAVKNNDVYLINNNASSRPSQNVIKALKEMAKAIYPEKYE